MNAYRGSVAPAFCRGCGERWDPSAQQCHRCGEPAVAARVDVGSRSDDRRLLQAIVAAMVLVLGTWGLRIAFLEQMVVDPWVATSIFVGPPVLFVISAALWGRPLLADLARAPERWAEALGLAALVALATWGLEFGLVTLIPEAVDVVTMHSLFWGALPWGAALALGLLNVVAEELAFRGVTYRGLTSDGWRYTPWVGTSVLFGLYGISLAYFAAGIALGFLRHRTGSPWPGIVARVLVFASFSAWV